MWMTCDTNTGQVRKNNQDAVKSITFDSDRCMMVVCDGMGGANGGAVASKVAADEFAKHVALAIAPDMGEVSIRHLLMSAAAAANAAVLDMATENPELKGMGTTLVAAVVQNGMAHFVHAGDSRAYLMREDRLTQLTRDHTVVQALLDRGDISYEQAENHPQRHMITRAVGVEPEMDFDIFCIPVGEGDAILLCTDGLYNMLGHSDLEALCSISLVKKDVSSLIGSANRNGGSDNITAGLICIGSEA